MIIDTELDIAHIELIRIFLKANELDGVIVREVPYELRNWYHRCIQLESCNEDSSIALTFMGVRHAGVLNMFDDYLLKCGIDVGALKPKSIYRQEQSEREDKLNEDFMKQLETKWKQNGNKMETIFSKK